MNPQRRTLMLGAPAAALFLHGCGGAEGNNSGNANSTAQSVNRDTAQGESTSDAGAGFTIRNLNGGNFPVIGGMFDIPSHMSLIQAVRNPGSPAGFGPVLSLQVSSSRLVGTETWIGALSLTVRLNDTLGESARAFDLQPGGALAGEGWVTCRRIAADGSLKTHGFRIVSGTLVVAAATTDMGLSTVSLQNVVAQAAVGFNNLAQGTLSISTATPVSLLTALENTGVSLS